MSILVQMSHWDPWLVSGMLRRKVDICTRMDTPTLEEAIVGLLVI